MKEQRKAGTLRSFIKLSNLNPRKDLINNTHEMVENYESQVFLKTI